MAKGSVRKKGSKWYYRFYVEDESGKLVQREFAGTASKSETEAMLRKAMEDYEAKKFVAKSENVTVGQLLDMWVEEELKPGSLSNGTVSAYQGTVGRIKQFPIGERKLKTVTPEHLQSFLDLLSFGGMDANGKEVKPISKGYMRLFSAVLQGAFRFAVFPKRLLSYNPMQYVVMRKKQESYELFSDDNSDELAVPTITYEQYVALTDWLKKKSNPALLPIQIAYFTGLRIGEVCALTWQDIDLKEQVITVRRSMRYNGARHKTEIGPTKRSKIRTVDFCDTLAEILKEAKKEQHLNRFKYGELYSLNYCKEVQEKGRSCTHWVWRKKCRRITRNSPSSASVPTGLMNPQAQSASCAGQRRRRFRALRTSISIHSDTRSRVTCSQTAHSQRTFRNFWDMRM